MLNRLEDYVFLSDRETQTNYIVERDGKVWLSPLRPDVLFLRQEPEDVALDWREFVPGAPRWRWRDGFLPVLEISDADNLLELTAVGEDLLVRHNQRRAWACPSGVAVPLDCFSGAVERTGKYWDAFFSRGWTPPVSASLPASAWKACFTQALSAFCGRHPKYGVGHYACNHNDGFPPTIISMADALLDYQLNDKALELLSYYLERFVMPDGAIDYLGVALSEYGMILNLCAKIVDVPGGEDWLRERLKTFGDIVRFLYRRRNPFIHGKDNKYRLLPGVPEADTRDQEALYAHNNAWVWRGLSAWAATARRLGFVEAAVEAGREADDLGAMLGKAIREMSAPDGLAPFNLACPQGIESFAESSAATYANYRYYPELLHSGFLGRDEATKLIEARERRGGELAGMTLFHFAAAFPGLGPAAFCCDNWPVVSYGFALAELGEEGRFMRTLAGHFLHHQTQDTFTSYESVDADVPGTRRAFTDWCVPAQLVYPRLLRWGCQKFGAVDLPRPQP